MRSLFIVKDEVIADAPPRVRGRAVFMQVHLFVFEAASEPLDENVIEEPAAAVHADGELMVAQKAEPGGTAKLHPLIGVADLGRRVLIQRPPKGAHAEVALQAVTRVPTPARNG